MATHSSRLVWAIALGLITLIGTGSMTIAATTHLGHVMFGGLPLPGVAITAKQEDKVFTAITDEDGAYSFPDLPDGVWTIEVEMSGFTTLKEDVTVTEGAPEKDWELKMLPLTEMSTVKAEALPAPVSDATNAATSGRGGRSSNSAPAGNARPGFTRTDLNASNNAPAPTANTSASALPNESADELAQRAADGLLINGSVNNGAASPFAQLAAFGNNRRTRSPYQGAFAFNVDNSALDARSYSLTGQDTVKPGYNHAVGSFTFGGPLRIPHLIRNGPQFFVSYQRTQNRNATTLSGLMPTAAERSGDLSSFAGPIIDPKTGLPFDGNQIPGDRISPQARALLSYFPQPNFTSNSRYNYQIPLVTTTHQDSLQTRMQKSINPRNQVSGDFAFQRTASDNTNLFGFLDTTQMLGINGSATWTHRFSPRVSTSLRYQISRLRTRVAPFFANVSNVSGDAGVTGNNQDPLYWGPPNLNFSGGTAGLSDGTPAFNRNLSHTFSFSSFWNRGPHSFTYGGDYRRHQTNNLAQQDPRGTFTFTGAVTGSDFADFLLGIPSTSSIAFGNADKYFRQSQYDLFVTDDWRVRTGLTMQLGVRWEYEAPMSELRDRLVNLDIGQGFVSATPVVGAKLNPDRVGIQPRIGLAWRPLPASSLVVRAGYGVYRNANVYAPIIAQMAQQAPLSTSLSVQNTPATPLTLANGFNVVPTTTPTTFAVDPNFRIGYAQTWNLSMQRDLPASLQMTATYTGTKGTRLMQEFLPNTYPAGSVNPCPTCPSGFAYLTSNGNSTRESGQVQLRRRLHNGLTASVQYTLAKSIDDAGFSAANPLIAQNWLDLRADRALSSFDQRHQVAIQSQYSTGMGVGGGTLLDGWRGALFKEWTVVTQITKGSGLPLTPIYLAPVTGTGITGSIRPDYTGAEIYLDGAGSNLNRAAFAAPAPGQWGNAGRNSITGPSQFSMNASISRTFRLGDRLNADLQVNATNLLNHVTFPNWNTVISSAQFGLPTSANQMRRIQTNLRIRF